MKSKNVKDLVLAALAEEPVSYTKVYEADTSTNLENQFLFFMKPEIVCGVGRTESRLILDILFEAFDTHAMNVESVYILPSEYLKEHGIMSEHYGVIDGTSRNAADNMSQQASNKFHEIYGCWPSDIPTLGGFDFLDTYPSFDAAGLNKIWASHEFTRLGGGTYSEMHRMDGRDVVMINGFYPNMLLHYTRAGRRIVLFELSSNTKWKKARTSLIGSTVPEMAEDGSIRNTLLERKSELGIGEISPSYNGVHLSAGPVEGLVELDRFLSERGADQKADVDISRFSFGAMLLSEFGEDEVSSIMSNKVISRGDELISVFDLTEELDAHEALGCLKEVSDQFK